MTFFLLAANCICFALMGIDKRKAKRRERRIPENTLLLSAACMGALGGVLGMLVFRHKTKHLKFVLLFPLFLVLELALLLYIR
ncbi:MAG: DUF1294 domain-containing protein [Oscillospiraceae bacterium]|nr:DUF1294 domain-containing protein [Oscillospiraceae bacterium]